MTFLGQNSISDLRLGDSQVQAAYLGNMKLWPEEEPAGGYWGLCFTAEEPGATIRMTKTGTPPSVSLLYSTDASTWDTFTPGTTTVTLANAGDKMWLKAGPGGNSAFATETYSYWRFATSKANASGSIMSLLDGEQQQTLLSATYCFCGVFRNSSIKTAPELPAMTLADYCYTDMFRDCTSLSAAPALPATTLVSQCYQRMFYGCTSLTQAPELPATTLVSQCYQYMFYDCTSLTSISADFEYWTPSKATMNWVTNVSSSGTFYCPTSLGTNDTITRGNNNCPTGWTVVNTDA